MKWTQKINTPFFLLIIEDIVKVSTNSQNGLVYVPLLLLSYRCVDCLPSVDHTKNEPERILDYGTFVYLRHLSLKI